jgi:hypothetical protein
MCNLASSAYGRVGAAPALCTLAAEGALSTRSCACDESDGGGEARKGHTCCRWCWRLARGLLLCVDL